MSETTTAAQETTEAAKEGTEAKATESTEVKATEQKTEAQKTEEPKAFEAKDLKLPEGSPLDAKAVDAIAEFAKANKLTVEQAQAQLERENANFAAYVEGQKAQFGELRKQWVEQAKADKEIGGENLPKAMEVTRRFLEKYAPKEFLDDLDTTGYGDYFPLLKFVNNVIKAAGFSEDTLVISNSSNSAPKSLEDVFYPQTAENK